MTKKALIGEKHRDKTLQEILQNSPMILAVIKDRQKQAATEEKNLPTNNGD